MQYAELSEAWNSPLSNKIREVENGTISSYPSSDSYYSKQNQNAQIKLNTGSIIPAWGSQSEPIEEYLHKNNYIARNSFSKNNFDYDSDNDSIGARSAGPANTYYEKKKYHKPERHERITKPEVIERIIEKPVSFKEEQIENDCNKIEEHINKCRYCYEKYKKDMEKNNNFVISLDYKNMLLTLVCFIIVVFIIYYALKK
jgi:hypothetical protein